MPLLHQTLLFLGATVVVVPLFRRLGLGSVLGYLAAGAVLGPYGLGLVTDVDSILHFAELGVVLLLFLIGLELQPTRLFEMRRRVFGAGSVQVLASGALLGGAALALGQPPGVAAVIGLGLSLSSTAFALQLLAERNELATHHGRAAFGILLFQDLAVIPVLAALPLLAPGTAADAGLAWTGPVLGLVALAAVVAIGRWLLRPVFRLVAAAQSQELFTAMALFVVLGTAALLHRVGLSMALGAFLAGVLLAESEYKHELEADIEPFKGLLLGLFFLAVGMAVNLQLLADQPLRVLGLVLGLLTVKGGVLYALGRWQLRDRDAALSLAAAIAQGGEFAFVLFSMAVTLRVMPRPTAELLIVAVSLSMAVSAPLFVLHQRWLRPRLKPATARPFDVAPDEDTQVIIAGFGRVGQIVARMLQARRISFTAMDSSPEHIDFVKRFGNKVFYGDASRLDLLRAARVDKAKVLVLAIDDVDASVHTAETVLQHFPHLTIFARARNRQHAYRLRNLGITNVVRETFPASLEMTEAVLLELGYTYSEACATITRFREHDEALLEAAFPFYKDEARLVEITRRARAELESLFEKDTTERPG